MCCVLGYLVCCLVRLVYLVMYWVIVFGVCFLKVVLFWIFGIVFCWVVVGWCRCLGLMGLVLLDCWNLIWWCCWLFLFWLVVCWCFRLLCCGLVWFCWSVGSLSVLGLFFRLWIFVGRCFVLWWSDCGVLFWVCCLCWLGWCWLCFVVCLC